jgi:hypothetical protein
MLSHGAGRKFFRDYVPSIPTLTMSSSGWGDNPDATPVDTWIPCTSERNNFIYTDTAFKLTQKLQIGDFYFVLKQNFTETMFVSPNHVFMHYPAKSYRKTNTTPQPATAPPPKQSPPQTPTTSPTPPPVSPTTAPSTPS